MQDTHRKCQSNDAGGCAYCIAPAVTHAIVHNCRASDYRAETRRVDIFDCSWTAVGTTRGNDWYAQAWNMVRRSSDYERAVKAALWEDRDVKGWLDTNIGYWNKNNPWAKIEGAVDPKRPGMTALPTSCRPADVAPLAHLVADWMHHRCRAPAFAHKGLSSRLFECAWQGIQGRERINEFVSRGYVKPEMRQWCREPVSRDAQVTGKETEVLLADAPKINDGATVATNWHVINLSDAEENAECKNPVFEGPQADYFVTPRDMLDWVPTVYQGDYGGAWGPPVPWKPGFAMAKPWIERMPSIDRYALGPGTIGANEGRLRSELRSVAGGHDPVKALCQAAQSYTRNAPGSANTPSDERFGNAFADLSVTGKAAFAAFVRLRPTEATLRRAPGCRGVTNGAVTKALDRAYAVANVLRTGASMEARRALGWIAVSGEDDQPHRPVNVPSVSLNTIAPVNGRPFSFPQFSIKVSVPGWPRLPAINTRYTIMPSSAHVFQRPTQPAVSAGGRVIAADYRPSLDQDAEVILFIHGMDSRAEEALGLTEALHKLRGKNWTVVSFDLPTSGYADNIDHRLISPTSAVDKDHSRAVPLLNYLEDYIVAFVDALGTQLPTLKGRVRAVVGGSLGGNMAMRLGRRSALSGLGLRPRADLSWIRAIVPWSPAAIWPSFANDVAGGLGHMNRPYAGVSNPLNWSGNDAIFVNEGLQRRRELFYGGFDWKPAGGLGAIFDPGGHVPQADLWWRPTWQCKQHSKLAARIDRHETYDGNFRRWHWRLAAEQCLFSQQETIPPGHYPIPSSVPLAQDKKPPLYFYNSVPMFLSCGRLDVGGGLCDNATSVSRAMVNTPGLFQLLENTGHSIDNERPTWFAKHVADFLGSPTVVCAGLRTTYGMLGDGAMASAPADAQATWRNLNCSAFVVP